MSRVANKPIPVPTSVRIKHLLANHLQGLLFVLSLVAVSVLWFRRSPRVLVTGQVQRVEVVVPANRDGVLRAPAEILGRFDRVIKDVTAVASLDVGDVMLEMQTLTAERERLEAQFRAERERLSREQVKWQWESEQQRRQVRQQSLDQKRSELAAQQRIDSLSGDLVSLDREKAALDLKGEETAATQRQSQLEFELLQQEIDRVERLVELKMNSEDAAERLRQQLKLVEQRVRDATQLGRLIQAQLKVLVAKRQAVQTRLDAAVKLAEDVHGPSPFDVASAVPPTYDEETTLEPFRQAIAVQDAKIGILAQRIADSQIMAPATGTVTRVHQRPGAFVRSGEPIVTIGSDEKQWIVAYLDDRQASKVEEKATVEIQIAGEGILVATSSVAERGNQVESVPVPLRRDPKVQEWGIPIKVPLPKDVPVVPGQMVRLTIQ